MPASWSRSKRSALTWLATAARPASAILGPWRVRSEVFTRNYASVFDGDERWTSLPVPPGDRYAWDAASTYVARPPFFEGISLEPEPVPDVVDARVLVMLGDSVTTDHISPAGS